MVVGPAGPLFLGRDGSAFRWIAIVLSGKEEGAEMADCLSAVADAPIMAAPTTPRDAGSLISWQRYHDSR